NYRHVARDFEHEWGAAGIGVLAAQAWTNYPIMLAVDDLGDAFELSAQTDRFVDPRRITTYMETAVQGLVQALEREPQIPIAAISILPDHERREIFCSFNDTAVAHPLEKLIHQLFEEQVERTPDAIAVSHNDRCFSYRELNSQANRLARYLRNLGVGADQPVG